MARIDHIKLRLNNWALWRARQNGHGLGFASVNVLLAMRVDKSRESHVPHDECDAEQIERAVESLKTGKGALYVTLHLYYLKGIGIRGVMREMGRSERTVLSNLEAADLAISAWLQEDMERRQQQRADYLAAITAQRKSNFQNSTQFAHG